MHETSSDRTYRLLMVLIAAAGCFLIFTTTERCFVNADVRNAIRMAQTLQATNNSPTIPEALLAQHPNISAREIIWTGHLTDNWYGFVNVRAAVPGPGSVVEYLFDVNLSGQRLHPANAAAKQLMLDLRNQRPSPNHAPPESSRD